MNLNNSPGAGPLTESDLDAAIRDSWPTPEACLLEDMDPPREPMTRTEARWLVAVYVLSAVAVVSAIAALIR